MIFQTSKSAQSSAIQCATHSRYSHMGMIVFRGGGPSVLEASGPVGFTPLDKWTASGVDKHYVVKRLRPAAGRITPAAMERANVLVRDWLGKPYDAAFDSSDQKMYCSELVWKIYDRTLGVRLGEPQKLRTLDLSCDVVRVKLHERFGDNVPLDEPVITPAAMFDSPLLELVVQR